MKLKGLCIITMALHMNRYNHYTPPKYLIRIHVKFIQVLENYHCICTVLCIKVSAWNSYAM